MQTSQKIVQHSISLTLSSLLSYLSLVGLVFSVNHTSAIACTSAYQASHSLMIKSYDWHDKAGYIYWNPKGIKRKALLQKVAPSKPHQWTSLWDNITFNQYGQGFPNGGMNEKGLSIEVLWLDSNQPNVPKTSTYMSELEWVQYHLDTSSTVKEVLSKVKQVDIAIIQGKIHYFVCDLQKQCASIEWTKGNLQIHTQVPGYQTMPYPTLTNHTYQQSQAFCETYLNQDGLSKTLPQNNKSLNRFTRTAKWTQNTLNQSNPVLQAFSYLDTVKYPNYTQWQIVYDQKNLAIYFKTSHHTQQREIHLKDIQKKWNVILKSISGKKLNPQCPSHWSYDLSNHHPDVINHLTFLTPKKAQNHLQIRMKQQEIPLRLFAYIFAHQSQCQF